MPHGPSTAFDDADDDQGFVDPILGRDGTLLRTMRAQHADHSSHRPGPPLSPPG